MILSKSIPNYILLDFDGTITMEDVAIQVLDQFAGLEWRQFDELLDRGQISLEECMRSQYGMIKSDEDKILEFIETKFILRDGFEDFIQTCDKLSIPVHVVSAGIDFVINHILRIHDIRIKLKAIKTQASVEGMKLEFNKLKYSGSRDFKEDYIKELRSYGEINIIYVGDGNTDFYAAENADIVYCVKGSRLETYCIEKKIILKSFSNFMEIENQITDSISH
jgi:HAD superfamily phosphoserine phosphatase-like hydrolase